MTATDRKQLDGWRGLLAWTVAGAVIGFAVVSMASVGVLVLPFGLAALVFCALRVRFGAESFGVVIGAGATLLLIAAINWDSRNLAPCSETGQVSVDLGEQYPSCGGNDPIPWLVVGLALATAGLASYVAVRSGAFRSR